MRGGVGVRREIEVEAGTIRLRENGIVDVVVKMHAEVTVERARAINAAVREVSNGPTLILADIRGMRRSGVLTQRYTAGPEGAAVTR